MPSALLLPDASSRQYLLPAALLLTTTLANVGTPVAHSLLTSALAWSAICVYTTLRLRKGSNGGLEGGAKRLAWIAGGLLALARICERAVDGRGIWWANAFLPLAVYCFLQSDLLGHDAFSPSPPSPPGSPDKSRGLAPAASGTKTSLLILTSTGVVAAFAALGSNATIALGLSYAVIEALAFLVELTFDVDFGIGAAGTGGGVAEDEQVHACAFSC